MSRKGGYRHKSDADLAALIGHRFSNLVIQSIAREDNCHAMATCRCDCGAEKVIRVSHILSGRQKGCGCGRAHTLRHGKSGTGIYQIWRSMRARCENPTDQGYSYYGARGIKVCERWKLFENFYADMGEKPAGMSIDRINVDGNYEPENCRWATKIEQQNNTTRSHRVAYRGQTMTAAQAMRVSGCTLPHTTVYGRLNRGWDIEKSLHYKGQSG